MKRILLFIFFLVLITLLFFVFRDEVKTKIFRVVHRYENYIYKDWRNSDINNSLEEVIGKYQDNIFGLDISGYQGKINWEKLGKIKENVPVSFIIIRATAGKNHQDKQFAVNWQKAKEKGIIRGAYHYYRPNENSELQAKNFINHVNLEKGDLPPVVDLEEHSVVQSMTSLKKGLKNWCDIIEKEYGVKPIIYTSEKFYLSYLNSSTFNKYPLWIANHKNRPLLNNFLIWQFTSTGRVDGINTYVDINMLNGHNKKLSQYLIK